MLKNRVQPQLTSHIYYMGHIPPKLVVVERDFLSFFVHSQNLDKNGNYGQKS